MVDMYAIMKSFAITSLLLGLGTDTRKCDHEQMVTRTRNVSESRCGGRGVARAFSEKVSLRCEHQLRGEKVEMSLWKRGAARERPELAERLAWWKNSRGTRVGEMTRSK